jgi:hypothetical protein
MAGWRKLCLALYFVQPYHVQNEDLVVSWWVSRYAENQQPRSSSSDSSSDNDFDENSSQSSADYPTPKTKAKAALGMSRDDDEGSLFASDDER